MTTQEELIAFLGDYVTENKKEKIAAVLEDRTRHVTIALEDIYQPHNASACLRTCECLGVQDVHIVETLNEYRPNDGVALGSSKWLSLHHYRTSGACIETLRRRDYRIVATSPAASGYDLTTLPLDRPVAILFGTEEKGLSPIALEAADTTLRLPMYGFTQSYNISVTVAVALARLVERLRQSDEDFGLSDSEKEELTLAFFRRIVKQHDLLEETFWETRDPPSTPPSRS